MHRMSLALSLVALTSQGCQIEIGGAGVTSAAVRIQEEATRSETHALELSPSDVLTLVTSYGAIEVESGDGPAELRATLRAHGRTEEEAQAVLERYHVGVERGPSGPRAELVGEPLVVHSGSSHMELSASVDFVAHVPAGTRLDARSESGNLTTRGALGSLALETGYGAIHVDEARGDVRAKSGSGDIQVARIEDEGGEVVLASNYGAVHVRASRARRLSCKSGSGDLRLDDASTEELELATQYGAILVEHAGGAVRAISGSGDVRVRGAKGAVVARSNYGAIAVEGELASLEAVSGSGDVHVTAQAGSRVDPQWRLESSYGQVVLSVPADFACALDARTDYGTVECAFPITLEPGKRRGNSALKGTIGAGGGAVTLVSGSGDVVLKKL